MSEVKQAEPAASLSGKGSSDENASCNVADKENLVVDHHLEKLTLVSSSNKEIDPHSVNASKVVKEILPIKESMPAEGKALKQVNSSFHACINTSTRTHSCAEPFLPNDASRLVNMWGLPIMCASIKTICRYGFFLFPMSKPTRNKLNVLIVFILFLILEILIDIYVKDK